MNKRQELECDRKNKESIIRLILNAFHSDIISLKEKRKKIISKKEKNN